jgi:glucose-6-phosphate isomerase/transaldolase/glucose-6-phosphate isomerase
MREACASCVPTNENPGVWLGAGISIMALQGRDKLTLLTSPAISSFGLWVEQLIAESTGKEGKGIIPVTGEPIAKTESYGDDRLFVYMRLEDDDNAAMDAAVERLKASGHPVLTLRMQDSYDLGAEFFRWEFATAIAGTILDINPFDQPDVQRAKDTTERLLQEYETSQHLPQRGTTVSLSDLLAEAENGKYLAITAYLHQTAEVDRMLAEFRRKVITRHQIATTFGYGPRFLHSTGQLHKGGPNSGLFLQITAGHEEDIPVPDKPYTFGIVADAQAGEDLEALQTLGRHVALIHSSRADTKVISRLLEELEPR